MKKTKAKILARADILGADDMVSKEVPVPQWGGVVIVRAMTGTERDAFETGVQKEGNVNIRARLAALTIVDADGNRIFNEKDIEVLGKKSAAALDAIFDVSAKLSGLQPDDVKELEGNS